MHDLTKRLNAFLFPQESDRWLTLFRIGLALQVVFYTLSSRADWNEIFSEKGYTLVNRGLNEALLSGEGVWVPRLGWLVDLGHGFGWSEVVVLRGSWVILLSAGLCLLAGVLTRPAAITAWFLHLSAVKSEEFLSYGMDNFTTIGLFYLMLCPLPDRLSADWRLGKRPWQSSEVRGFFRRVLQMHVCLIYFFGGFTKCMGVGWWNGDSLWRALNSPPYDLISSQTLASWSFLLPAAGMAVCLLETAYPLLIWIKRTRLPCLMAICGMHVGIALVMGLHLFSSIMIILNLAAFGPDFSFSWPNRLTEFRKRTA